MRLESLQTLATAVRIIADETERMVIAGTEQSPTETTRLLREIADQLGRHARRHASA